MKKLVLAALLSIGMIGFAQNGSERQKLTAEQRNEKQLQQLTSELNLDHKQQKQVGDLLASQTAEMQQWKTTNKDKKTKATTAQREAMTKQMKDKKGATDAQMKAILTPEQYRTYTANKEKKTRKMDDRKHTNDKDQEQHEDHME